MEGELFTKNHKQPNILSARFGNERTVRKYVRNIFWKQALTYVRVVTEVAWPGELVFSQKGGADNRRSPKGMHRRITDPPDAFFKNHRSIKAARVE